MRVKKQTKRSRTKYPGLEPSVNSKLRWEYMDQDYIDKLSDEEKQWLSNFMEEDLSGNFNHPGKKLYRSKEKRRACYGRNNSRNRDLYAIYRTRGMVGGIDDFTKEEDKRQTNPEDTENTLIELIDYITNPESPEEDD